MLIVENLSKTFRNGPVALQNTSFDLPAGSFAGVIGPSGAGKSTLLRVISRLIEADSGRVTWEGRDITALRAEPLRQWRATCAMIFQQFNLVGRLDTLTNVLLGGVRRRSSVRTLLKLFTRQERREALELLEQLGVLPQALQRVETLSGGQQQRVAIARALYQKPRIILADEPVSSLDPHNSTAVMDFLARINVERGITVICNLHSLDYARRYCGRVIAMSGGRVIFNGTPEELTGEKTAAIYVGPAAPALVSTQ